MRGICRSAKSLLPLLLLVAAGIRQGLAAEVAPVNRAPYISTYYIRPKVPLGEAAVIDYYVTDFDHKEYLDDDTSERFVIEYWVNGAKGALADVPAGDRSLNLGVLPKGRVLFALQATDRLGIKSHRLYQEFRVVDPAEEVIQPGEVFHPDLAAFNISSNDTEPVATTAGLTALVRWASTNGYRKVVLPPGRYRIDESNTVQMASGVTLDMNGSTFKLNPNALAKALMLEFVDCLDAHVVNGLFEGDLLEHDFANAPNNSEWLNVMSISQGSEYCSVEDVVITNVTGYGTCSNHRHTYNTSGGIGNRFVPGDIGPSGEEVPSTVRTTNTNYMDIDRFLKSYGFIQLGLYLGYQGNPAGHWIYKAHFYDAEQRYIESIEGYLYRRLYPPANARYARFTLYSTAQPDGLCVFNFRAPYNCAYRNIRHVNVRCVGMALAGMNNMLVEGCRFDNCGWASAKCAFDAEDGWDLMQDLTFRNNIFGSNPVNEYLTCAGHNFVMENNVMKSYIWDRTRSYVFRGNQHKQAGYRFGTGFRTGYVRISGNTNSGPVQMTSATETPDKPQAVRGDRCLEGASGTLGRLLKFYRCEISNGAFNGRAEECLIQVVTNAGQSFEIVDSVVSNSYLKQSQAVVARVEGSEVVGSRLHVQGGLIIAAGNRLLNTDSAVTGDWNTNNAFCFTDNRIETPKSGFLTVGNSFKRMLFTNNQVLATAPGFKFVTLSNPNTSAGTPAATNMWVCFAGNRFSAAGGTVLQSGAPAAGNRLLVDFHTNVYNEIGLYNATISNKSNVVITILPGLPTGLAAAFGTPAAPENGGPGSVPLTISRYRDTAGPLTVHLASSQPALLVVPASVIIPAGETSVTLWLDALDNTGQDGHQTVTVTATADGFTAGSAPVAVHDDECAGLAQVPAEAPLPLVEGGTASYTLALGTVPAATVTVTLQPQAPLAAAPATLVFGPENWSQPQTVTVAHPDTDTQADPPRERLIGYLLASDDPAYQGLAAPALTVAVADNDPPALVLTAAVATVSEAAGGAATTVTLYRNTPATNALSVAMTSSHPDILRIDSPAMIPAGTAGITLDVDVLDDAVIEPDVPVTLSAAAAGFVEGSVVITVKDDDTPPTAITNVVPYAESFETWVAGAPLQPARGWYAGDTQSCTVVQETYAYAAPLPLDVQHTKVAALNGPVVNRIVRQTGLTWFDMMLAPTLGDLQREDLEEHDTGLLFSEEGLLRLFHRDLAGGTNRWTTLGHPAIATGAWVRISMGVDYATSDPAFPGIRFLRLFVDGQPIASGQALTDNRGGGEPGGHWFAIHPRPGAGILELGFQDGPCRLDDLVVTPRAPATPAGTAWPWLADHGLATADELSDLDRDGFTAADEYVALTDPTDAESRFMIQAVEPSASALRLGVPSAAGRLYTVERRETPGGGDWQPVPPWIDVPGTGAMLWLPATNGLPSGFFRARVRLAD